MANTSIFPSFPNLPLELRLRIWTFAFPTPQLVSLVAYTEEERALLLKSTSSDDSDAPRKWLYMYLERCSTLSIAKPHPLLHTNHESRSWTLSHHHLLTYQPEHEVTQQIKPKPEQTSPQQPTSYAQNNNALLTLQPSKLKELNLTLLASQRKPYTLFNPTHSILFLIDPAQNIYYSSLTVIHRWLAPSLLSSLRILAISYYTWRKDRKFHLLPILYSFLSLERLYVCFVGSGTEWTRDENGAGGGWLDAVRREDDDMNGMLRQIEREVLEDVEELGRKIGGSWKRPVVKVLRDRKAAVKDWESGV